MKILYCMNCLAGKGGMERVTIVKANALADIPGNEVAICFTDKGNFPYTIHPLDSRIKVYYLDTPYWDLYTVGRVRMVFEFFKRVLATKKAIEQVIIDFKPDVLVNTGSYEKFACALISSKKYSFSSGKLKKIREFHFFSKYREYIAEGIIDLLIAKSVTLFEKFVLSHFFDCSFLLTNKDLQDNYSKFKNCIGKVAVQYNPCSFKNECSNLNQREKILLAVGRVCRQKNFEDLIEIWSRIAEKLPQWKLRIVGGNSNEVAYLNSVCERYNVASSVELPGWSSDIPSEMEKASVLCCTSIYEGFSLVLIEAMHYGLPVVSWDLPYGPSEIIEDGINGYLTPFGKKDILADKLLELLSNPDKIELMRPQAIRQAKNFTAQSIANQWMQHFESC